MRFPESRLGAAPSAGEDLRPSTIAILFVALLVLAAVPLVAHPLPPLQDYANHLARAYVINAIGSDPDLARFYWIDWQIIPNLMVDLVVPVLNWFADIYVAGQIFSVLSFVAIISGALALHRALFGRWSALPLIGVPLLYNGVMLVGVMNYVFGIGLALWGLAVWTAWRERSWPWRFAASTAFVLLLFICHLFAAGVYALGLLAFELNRLWMKRSEPLAPRLVDFVATGIPFLAVAALLVTGPTWNAPGIDAFWDFWGKLEGFQLAFEVYYPEVGLALLAAAGLAGIAAAYYRALHFHPVGWAVLAVGTLVYLALPRALFAAHMADARLPIALAFMLIACLDLRLRTATVRYGFIALLVVLASVRVGEVQHVWSQVEPRTMDFFRSVHSIEQGSRVLVVSEYDDSSTNMITRADIAHAASLATIERSALVTTNFTVKGKHILQVRDRFRNMVELEDRLPPSMPFFLNGTDGPDENEEWYFWDLWPLKYEYVYILDTKRGKLCAERKHLKLVHDGVGFQLYRVVKPQMLTGTPESVHPEP
ncbi:MAG: hypothetical protein IT539_03925 [Bradyrhizobiaceae bacterium]|nr:hypothetical protein [Bradyrhizobiaceae bacterium]